MRVKKQDMISNDYDIKIFEGPIEYGKYSGTHWYGLQSEKNPIWKWIQHRIIKETPNQDIFDIYLSGGLIEEWITWDADIFIFGPYDPPKIYETLDTITRIGFEEHLWIDVAYQDRIWDIHNSDNWIRDEQFGECRLSNHWSKNGKVDTSLYKYEYRHGLYQKVKVLPFPKHWDNLEKGYTYKSPIKLNK